MDDSDRAMPSARVIESAVELARAEGKLVLSHVRILSLRALSAVLITLVATSLTQVAILLLALSPVLVAFRPWPTILLSGLVPVVAAIISIFVALRSWRRLLLAESAPSTPPLVSSEHTQ
jgi:hypothetical protein